MVDPYFPDITGHWAEQAIDNLARAGLVSGYPDGTFGPDKPVTRAEMCALFDRIAWRNGWINVFDFGAKGWPNDDSKAIQDAIDWADSHGMQANEWQGGMKTVFFPPMAYNVTKTLFWTDCHLLGAGAMSGSNIMADGPSLNGKVTLEVATGHNQNNYKEIRGLGFFCSGDGRTSPATHLDFTGAAGGTKTVIDMGLRVVDCSFEGTSDHCIRIGPWFNCHFRGLRFDGAGSFNSPGDGFCILMQPGPTQFGSVFVLDRFIMDNTNGGTGSGGGRGLIGIDDSNGPSKHVGVVRIANGRVEINTPLAEPRGPLLTMIDNGLGPDGTPITAPIDWAVVTVENVIVQNVVGQPGGQFVFSKSPKPQDFHVNVIGSMMV